jgi:hypothetical protein
MTHPLDLQVGSTGVYLTVLNSQNSLVTKWARNGQLVWSYSIASAIVSHSLRLSPDENFLMLGALDGTGKYGIMKLNSSTGAKLFEFYLPTPSTQQGISFSPDSSLGLVSGSNTSIIWHVFNTSSGTDLNQFRVTAGNTSTEFAYDNVFLNNSDYLVLISSSQYTPVAEGLVYMKLNSTSPFWHIKFICPSCHSFGNLA